MGRDRDYMEQYGETAREPLRIMTKYTYGNGDHYEGQVLAERRDIRDGQGIFYCSNK